MSGVHRLGDVAAGHGCPPGGGCGFAPPTVSGSASPNVLVNGLGAVRMGDIIVPHSCQNCAGDCDSPCAPHVGTYIGSRNVFVNNRPIQVIGDMITCMSRAISGSGNVMAN